MNRVFVIIAIVFVQLCILNSCDKGTQFKIDGNSSAFSLDKSDNKTVVFDQPFFLTEKSDNNIISVQVPVLKTENADKVNQIIYQYINDRIDDLCLSEYNIIKSNSDIFDNDAEYSECYLYIKYRVSLNSENLLSIIFDGIFNYRSAAHPTNVFFTLNINPKTAEQIVFLEDYALDEGMYRIFVEYAQHNLSQLAQDASIETLCSKDDFLNGIENQSGFYCYYTKDSIGISYQVPHAIGDHLEVEIPLIKLDKAA